MRFFSKALIALSLMSAAFTSLVQASDIDVSNAYMREVIPGNSVTSAYMTISNQSDAEIKLVAATSSISPTIEIHEHTMRDGMMRMGQVAGITIGAGEQATLQPMGLHLMVFDLAAPLKAGQQVTMTLAFENNQKIDVTMPVRSIKQAKHHHH